MDLFRTDKFPHICSTRPLRRLHRSAPSLEEVAVSVSYCMGEQEEMSFTAPQNVDCDDEVKLQATRWNRDGLQHIWKLSDAMNCIRDHLLEQFALLLWPVDGTCLILPS